jgi:2-oxoglutarate ferredoxin oxidoreductase subunit gamma
MFCQNVRETNGFILYDKGQVIPREDIKVKQVGVAATEAALQRLENKQVANIVLVGALLEITRIVSSKAIRKAINAHVSKQFRALNLKALQVGMELGRRAHG